MKIKILIIEDDEVIAVSLKNALSQWGYEVYTMINFDNIVDYFKTVSPQLVLLDINLPTHNGYYWCQEIRKISTIPIIFISSKTENIDIIMAMQYGADEFITKPIDLGVTIAKVQAMLRRTYDYLLDNKVLTFKQVCLDVNKSFLSYHQKTIELTKIELQIMEELFLAQGSIVKKEKIMDRCWQGDDYIDINTLAVNINRLRKKLKSINLCEFIKTKKGIGYYLLGE